MTQLPDVGIPYYERVKSAIARKIEGEEWPADFQLPGEEELAGQYGVSRLTVRRALRELQDAGMVVRIQGRGTFVVGPRMQCAIFDIRDLAEEIELSGGVHSMEVIALGPVDPESPSARLLPAARIFHSRILHKEDETPIQLEDRFVNADHAPFYGDQDFTRITPHAYLTRETEVTHVENTIRAIRADETVALLLQLEPQQPCLLLDRRTWRENEPVTRSRFIYPGDRYQLRSQHEASQGRTLTAQPGIRRTR